MRSSFTSAPTRMVWLPGAYQTSHEFLDAGFSEAVQRRRLALDLVFVDMELEHLTDRSILNRLRSQVVLPARETGCALWLGGISLGGFMALDYARTYPGDIDGLCLFAPYLGNRMLIAEIAAARGVAAWQPGELAETDEERRVWRYIKTRGTGREALHLGFGREDRFGPAQALLAAALPAESVDIIAGGHEWGTWSRLWDNFLDARFARWTQGFA